MIHAGDVIWVGLGGSAGAVARFVVDAEVRARLAAKSGWLVRLPAGTIFINVTGSFVLGLLTGLVMYRAAPSLVTTLLGTGFCGGYTTFSTASFETVRLVQQRAGAAAWVNALGTLLGALLAGALGLLASRI